MKKSLVFRIWSQLWLLHLHSLLLHAEARESQLISQSQNHKKNSRLLNQSPAETEDEPAPAEENMHESTVTSIL